MRTLGRVLLCMRSDASLSQMRTLLSAKGYPLAEISHSGAEALRISATQNIDIAIVGFTLPDITGVSLSRLLQQKCHCGVLLLVPLEHENYVRQQLIDTDIVTLQKPVSRNMLVQALEMMTHFRERISQLESEMHKLHDSLNRQNVVEKAKVKLMQERNISENSAYRFLQKESMNTGKPLEEIAQIILKRRNES